MEIKMILQLHHQIRNKNKDRYESKFCYQFEIDDNLSADRKQDELGKALDYANKKWPLSENSQWILCTQDSDIFIKQADLSKSEDKKKPCP